MVSCCFYTIAFPLPTNCLVSPYHHPKSKVNLQHLFQHLLHPTVVLLIKNTTSPHQNPQAGVRVITTITGGGGAPHHMWLQFFEAWRSPEISYCGLMGDFTFCMGMHGHPVLSTEVTFLGHELCPLCTFHPVPRHVQGRHHILERYSLLDLFLCHWA